MKKSAEDIYEILHQIGRGSYASVHKAINRQTGEICAIKKIPVTSELGNLINEIEIMSDCECKNIVRYLNSACPDREVSIIMEYCCGGSVKDVMRSLNRTLTQDQITVILKDVLSGLDYLHSKGKIHRDVKAANILLNEDGIAKLGDFGVSEPLDTSIKKRHMIGTLLWLPPEVINRTVVDRDYSSVIDIWSLGITIIEMAEGQPPYSDLEPGAALKEIANVHKSPPSLRDTTLWSQNLINFLSLCLYKNEKQRKKSNELLQHDLIKNSPSNEKLKSLVAEVCSTSTKATEANLYQKSECLLRENAILFGIYKKRRMKVVKVDSMTESLKSVESGFNAMRNDLTKRDSKVSEIISHSRQLETEIHNLEKETNDLRIMLDSQIEQKQKLSDKLVNLRKQQEAFESNERKRRLKLESLEGLHGS